MIYALWLVVSSSRFDQTAAAFGPPFSYPSLTVCPTLYADIALQPRQVHRNRRYPAVVTLKRLRSRAGTRKPTGVRRRPVGHSWPGDFALHGSDHISAC
jgi:hypothetical protein